MKTLKIAALAIAFVFALGIAQANAKASVTELYAHAVMTGDAAELEKLLAPNFWYIGSNGHIRDKEHFIQEIREKRLVIDRITFTNVRETKVGDTSLLTANGEFKATSDLPRPQGMMRYTMVVVNNMGKEQVALYQATPVIATTDCKDGNCRIK